MSKPKQNVGRLAFRVEGDWWVCYYAKPNTMDGAIRMATIAMGIVRDAERKEIFMGLMRNALGEFLEEHFGEVATWKTETAPESERSGSA